MSNVGGWAGRLGVGLASYLLVLSWSSDMVQGESPLVIVSSFAGEDQGGLTAYHLDVDAGQLELLQRSGDIPNPFFFDITPDGRYLYSVHAERFSGGDDNQLAAFRLERSSGALQLLGRRTTRGTASCFVEVVPGGRSVLVANYSSGSVVSLAIDDAGKLSPPVSFVQHTGSSVNVSRQNAPHAHCFVTSPDGRFAYAADLGIDQIVCYRLDSTSGELAANQQPFVRTPPGAGPRHLTFHPDGTKLYVINELANSITHFDFDPSTGFLVERQTISTLPEDFAETSHCADLKITPDGKFLYGTNRGHDSIAAYAIGEDGALERLEIQPSLGKGPQNLAITADGRLLLCANMPGDNLVVFRIDPASGLLEPLGEPLPITSPSCLRILP